jgi:penicillin amidase
MARLTVALFGDELGPLYDGFARFRPQLLQAVVSGKGAWCDDVGTPERLETCPQMLAASLGAAQRDLAGRYGADIAAWRWGDAHRAVFRNPALDWMPVIGPLTRISIPTGGDDCTVSRGTSFLRGDGNRFDHVHGATLRAIYDMADLDAALFAAPGGQSGNPLSPHYRDLTRPWRDGVYLTLAREPRGPLATLRLIPAKRPRS